MTTQLLRCPVCNKSYKTKNGLFNHTRKVCKNADFLNVPDRAAYGSVCACGKLYLNDKSLTTHVKHVAKQICKEDAQHTDLFKSHVTFTSLSNVSERQKYMQRLFDNLEDTFPNKLMLNISTLSIPARGHNQPRPLANHTDSSSSPPRPCPTDTKSPESQSLTSRVVFVAVMAIVWTFVCRLWYDNLASSNPTFHQNVEYVVQYNQQLEQLVHNDAVHANLTRQYGNELYSPLVALQEFGKELFDAWSSGNDYLESGFKSAASLQISGDDHRVVESVISTWVLGLRSMAPRVNIIEVDAADLSHGLLEHVNAQLRQMNSEVPIVIVVRNAQTKTVMQLKDHLDASRLVVDQYTDEIKFFRGIGFLFVEHTMSPRDCQSMMLADYDIGKLGWYMSFVSRLKVKARVCST